MMAEVETRSAHGTPARYVFGCRCDDCRHAAARSASERAARRAALGPLLLPAAPLAALLEHAVAADISLPEIARAAGVNPQHLQRLLTGKTNVERVQRSTRDAVVSAVESLVEARMEVLESLRRELHGISWPASAVRVWAALHNRPLTALAINDRRQVYRGRGRFEAARAEAIARTLGADPQDIWPEWE